MFIIYISKKELLLSDDLGALKHVLSWSTGYALVTLQQQQLRIRQVTAQYEWSQQLNLCNSKFPATGRSTYYIKKSYAYLAITAAMQTITWQSSVNADSSICVGRDITFIGCSKGCYELSLKRIKVLIIVISHSHWAKEKERQVPLSI